MTSYFLIAMSLEKFVKSEFFTYFSADLRFHKNFVIFFCQFVWGCLVYLSMNIQFYGVQIFYKREKRTTVTFFESCTVASKDEPFNWHLKCDRKIIIRIFPSIFHVFFQWQKRDYFHYEMLDFYYNIHKLVWLSFQAIKG